jgi:hypothetical protein
MLELVLVEHATGSPVTGATIRWASADEFTPYYKSHKGEKHGTDEILDSIGAVATSDAAGRASVACRPTSTTFFIARKEKLYGSAQLRENTAGPLTIELCEDRTLRIRTVDSLGRPCPGVPIEIELKSGHDSSGFGVGTTSGATAELAVDHIESLCLRPSNEGEVSVRAAIPSTRSIEAAVDRRSWPDEPVTLALPPVGQLVVELVTSAGLPLTRSTSVSLVPRAAVASESQQRETSERAMSKEGLARFAHVELGLTFTVAVSVPGREEIRAEASGPTLVGEEARARIVCGAEPTTLVGRLVDADGTPIAKRKVKSTFIVASGGGSSTQGTSLETDADGRFRHLLHLAYDAGSTRTWILSCTLDGSPLALSAHVDLSRELPAGDFELGNVRLTPTRLIASGVVNDDTGAAIAGAVVNSRALPGLGEVKSDESGRFALYGATDMLEVDLGARLARAQSDRLPIRVGATDVRIVMGRKGGLEGSLLVDEHTPVAMLRVRVAPQNKRVMITNLRLERANTFQARELDPGEADVSLILGDDEEPVWSIAGVQVIAGETTRDPRMQEIDLRGLFQTLRIQVLAQDQRPIEDGYVLVTGAVPSHGQVNAAAIARGQAELPVHRLPVDLELVSTGFLTARLLQVDGPRTVVLERAIEVKLVLDSSFPLPEEPYSLQANLLPLVDDRVSPLDRYVTIFRRGQVSGQSSPSSLTDAHTFGPSREIRVFVTELGPQKLYFVSIRKSSYGSDSNLVEARAQDAVVEIGPNDGGRILRVAPDAAAYAERVGKD